MLSNLMQLQLLDLDNSRKCEKKMPQLLCLIISQKIVGVKLPSMEKGSEMISASLLNAKSRVMDSGNEEHCVQATGHLRRHQRERCGWHLRRRIVKWLI